MASQEQLDQVCKQYNELMVEAKARIFSMNAIGNNQRGLPSSLVKEFCALQIRMLCEVIGLGCLVAQGDLVAIASKRLEKAWEPGVIFATLERLHSDFFPVPVKPVETATGVHFAAYDGPPYATKEEVRQIWSRCGEILHRGTLKSLLKEGDVVETSFSDVSEWGQKLSNLLSNHRILSLDRRFAFVVLLANGSTGVTSADEGHPVTVMVGEAT